MLRHEYHRVSDTVVWNVVQDRLQPLKAAIEAMEAALDEDRNQAICAGADQPAPPCIAVSAASISLIRRSAIGSK